MASRVDLIDQPVHGAGGGQLDGASAVRLVQRLLGEHDQAGRGSGRGVGLPAHHLGQRGDDTRVCLAGDGAGAPLVDEPDDAPAREVGALALQRAQGDRVAGFGEEREHAPGGFGRSRRGLGGLRLEAGEAVKPEAHPLALLGGKVGEGGQVCGRGGVARAADG